MIHTSSAAPVVIIALFINGMNGNASTPTYKNKRGKG